MAGLDLSTGRGEPDAGADLAYLVILRKLGDQRAAVNTALREAHTADTPPARQQALTALHIRLRQMAATTNEVLGARPDEDTYQP